MITVKETSIVLVITKNTNVVQNIEISYKDDQFYAEMFLNVYNSLYNRHAHVMKMHATNGLSIYDWRRIINLDMDRILSLGVDAQVFSNVSEEQIQPLYEVAERMFMEMHKAYQELDI